MNPDIYEVHRRDVAAPRKKPQFWRSFSRYGPLMKAVNANLPARLTRLYVAIALTLMLAPSGCSSADPVGTTTIQREKTASQQANDPSKPDNPGSGTRSSTSQIQGGSNNDYTGTIDPELISAAYLVCGKTDDQGNYIGCNAYETRTDRRLPLETRPDVRWVAMADNAPLPAVDPAPTGPKVPLAFAAKMRGGTISTASQNPRIHVMLYSGGILRNEYSASLATMPLVADMIAFGKVSGLSLSRSRSTIAGDTLSLFLLLAQRQNIKSARTACRWFDALGPRIGRPCNGKSFFPFYDAENPMVEIPATISGPDLISQNTYCDNFANMLQGVACN